jgi:hypothetical protein
MGLLMFHGIDSTGSAWHNPRVVHAWNIKRLSAGVAVGTARNAAGDAALFAGDAAIIATARRNDQKQGCAQAQRPRDVALSSLPKGAVTRWYLTLPFKEIWFFGRPYEMAVEERRD